MCTHLSLRLWIVSTWSPRRWKWPLWWTLCRTVSPRSPSARSVCSSHQPSHSCICHRHTPQPRQESISTTFFFFLKAHLSWNSTGGAVCCVWAAPAGQLCSDLRCDFSNPRSFSLKLFFCCSLLTLLRFGLCRLVLQRRLWFPLLLLFLVSGHRLL